MKIVADEGVDRPIVDALRQAGFVVAYFAELAPGADDPAVLLRASSERSLLLTADKDFGELVFRQRLASAGVVLIRLAGLRSSAKAALVRDVMQRWGQEMEGRFSVISPGLLRVRRV